MRWLRVRVQASTTSVVDDERMRHAVGGQGVERADADEAGQHRLRRRRPHRRRRRSGSNSTPEPAAKGKTATMPPTTIATARVRNERRSGSCGRSGVSSAVEFMAPS